MTDDIAERARKIGATSLRSIGDIARHQRLQDNNAEFVDPRQMLAELAADNQQVTRYFRAAHAMCDEHNDVATASSIENWIDETERRTWSCLKLPAPDEQSQIRTPVRDRDATRAPKRLSRTYEPSSSCRSRRRSARKLNRAQHYRSTSMRRVTPGTVACCQLGRVCNQL